MMEPGRELEINIAVAKHVMGFHAAMSEAIIGGVRCWSETAECMIVGFNPVRDIADAWQVVERFRRGDIKAEIEALMVAACVELEITDYPEPDGDCLCRIYSPTCAKVEARAHEMPLAICKASLKAVGYEVEK